MASLKSLVSLLGRSFFIVLIAALTLVGGTPKVAFAHNSISGSSPSNNEVLAASPTEWAVTFEKSVPLNSASGQLIYQDGTRLTLDSPRHGATDNVIVFLLPEKISGQLTARWRSVSSDGHVVSGRIPFTVAVPEPSPNNQSPSSNTLPQIAAANDLESDQPSTFVSVSKPVVRFSTFVAVALFGGLVFAQLYLARGTLLTSQGQLLSQISAAGLFLLPIASLALLANDLSDSSGSALESWKAAISLNIGSMTVFRFGTGLILFFATRKLTKQSSVDDKAVLMLTGLLVMYCTALAFGGHSRSERFPWLGIPVDVVHVLSIAAWLGGLVAMLAVIVPAVSATQSLDVFRRFSYAAERAVILIVFTGAIQTFRLHQSLDSLVTSQHGLLTVAKVSLMILMLRLAYANRKLLIRPFSNNSGTVPNPRTAIIRQSAIEILLGGVAMGVTTFLVATPLP